MQGIDIRVIREGTWSHIDGETVKRHLAKRFGGSGITGGLMRDRGILSYEKLNDKPREPAEIHLISNTLLLFTFTYENPYIYVDFKCDHCRITPLQSLLPLSRLIHAILLQILLLIEATN